MRILYYVLVWDEDLCEEIEVYKGESREKAEEKVEEISSRYSEDLVRLIVRKI